MFLSRQFNALSRRQCVDVSGQTKWPKWSLMTLRSIFNNAVGLLVDILKDWAYLETLYPRIKFQQEKSDNKGNLEWLTTYRGSWGGKHIECLGILSSLKDPDTTHLQQGTSWASSPCCKISRGLQSHNAQLSSGFENSGLWGPSAKTQKMWSKIIVEEKLEEIEAIPECQYWKTKSLFSVLSLFQWGYF